MLHRKEFVLGCCWQTSQCCWFGVAGLVVVSLWFGVRYFGVIIVVNLASLCQKAGMGLLEVVLPTTP